MMGTIVEVRTHNMWFTFKSQKTIRREEKAEETDRKIAELKADTLNKAEKASEAVQQLNKLVEAHGISGLIYFSTGKGKK